MPIASSVSNVTFWNANSMPTPVQESVMIVCAPYQVLEVVVVQVRLRSMLSIDSLATMKSRKLKMAETEQMSSTAVCFVSG